MSGSTKLTEEQQTFYLERFGKRYFHVQQTPQYPSREDRRKAARRAQKRNDGSPKE